MDLAINVALLLLGAALGWFTAHVYYRKTMRSSEAQHQEMQRHIANQTGRIEPSLSAVLQAVEHIPGVKIARDSAGNPTGGIALRR